MSSSIIELVDNLPQGGLTVKVLQALDFVAPGTWHKSEGFDSLIQQVTGVHDRAMIERIRDRALELYGAEKAPYPFCIRLYQTIDKTDAAIGTAAMANKVGEKIQFLSLLNKLTPKADTLQAFDLVTKLAVELIVFCRLNRIEPNPRTFAAAVSQTYTGAALTRMAMLVCIDGLLPLGPEFLNKVEEIVGGSQDNEASNNMAFKAVDQFVPGENTHDKLAFVRESFESVQGWMRSFVERTGISPSRILSSIGNFVDAADGKMDFVAAFLDQTTNYFEYTGIQTVATRLIQDAYAGVQDTLPAAAPPAAAFTSAQPTAAPPTQQKETVPPERIGPDGKFNQNGLAQRVLVAYKQDLSLASLSLYVAQAGGKVVIKGQVPSPDLRDRAVQLAQRERGCTEVDASQVQVG